MNSEPITAVCVVTDRTKCPPGYEVISSTTDNQDADLWKDKRFGKKITRYLCFSRNQTPAHTVLVDLTVIKEGETIPTGYTCISKTTDSGESVLKKKQLLVHLISGTSTQQAVIDIYLSSAKNKQKPVESSPRGDINGMSLFLRIGPVNSAKINSTSTISGSNITPLPANNAPPPYVEGTTQDNLPMTTPYTITSSTEVPVSPSNLHSEPGRALIRQSTLSRTSTLRTAASSCFNVNWPIIDVPFEMNKVFTAVNNLSQFNVPRLEILSVEELEIKYHYDFSTEKQAKHRLVATTP